MAYHVKQEWGEQYESDHLRRSKLPRVYFEPPHQLTSESAALPLFVPEPVHRDRMSSLSAFSDSTSTATRFARVRGFFSLTQWQELELQALVFKYMLVKAPVPAQLIDSIKRSLPDNNPALYLHHPHQQYNHFQQGTMLRAGYLGSTMDPEPGRCRRTDGKKWRCSKDVVDGQKYCDRHMHRGRNRSRKPVESSTQLAVTGGLRTALSSSTTGMHFALPVSTPTPLNTRYPEIKQERGMLEGQCANRYIESKNDGGQTLLPFFDDLSKEQQQEPSGININVDPENLPTGLSISTPGEQQQLSDFTLKLATGNGNELRSGEKNVGGEHNGVGWGAGWRNHSMGGPLAEALQQSASSSSPTSVLIGEAARTAGSGLSSVSN